MRVKVSKHRGLAVRIGLAGAAFMIFGLFSGYAMAKVTGPCNNCHTMHNSQAGTNIGVVHIGAGAGWSTGGNPSLINGTEGTTEDLLKTNCLGCHSAVDSAKTIITDAGGNKTPIVFNMGGTYPNGIAGAVNHPLAGGNFALNTGAANVYGHNVYGISNVDAIGMAPGYPLGCANSCHQTLAWADGDPSLANFIQDGVDKGKIDGCRGCHVRVGHHNAADPSYRFLGGHGGAGIDKVWGDTLGTGLGTTFEDADWEQTKGAADHNFYLAGDSTDLFLMYSMGRFCAGCHGEFHSMGIVDNSLPMFADNGGDPNTDNLITRNSGTNPWLRHPTNANIPFDPGGEYMLLNNAAYNPDVPVAQAADVAGWAARNTIGSGDQVMCLSCHRAHASQYPDALRFDYSLMNAHNAAVGDQDTTGCFFCHKNKDT